MHARLSTLYLVRKLSNITCGEMIQFVGVLLKISLEPRKNGRYVSYFTENPTVRIGDGYMVELKGYNAWAKEVMQPVPFK